MSRKLFAILMVGVGIVANVGCQTGCQHCKPCLNGCRPGHIGWQRGGTDYQRTLNSGTLHNHHADYYNQAAGSGVQGAQVGYPYYSHRGPRDFFVNNPPTIGR